MKFKSELISTKEQKVMEYNSSYKGCYNTMQFVLRLRDDVRKVLNEFEEITPEKFQAFSTYLHENIHWWQHIGSNFGFLFSTSYPSYVITSYGNLHKLIKKDIRYKPFRRTMVF